MRGLVRGVALLTALVLGGTGAVAQNRAGNNSYYDNGGYLVRPYAKEDDYEPAQAAPDTTESTRRQRRPRSDSPDTLTQVPQIRPSQGSSAQRQNATAPTSNSETSRQNSRSAPSRSAEDSSDSEIVIPPLPLRRPQLADAPHPTVAALAATEGQPAPAEEPQAQEAPISLHNAVVETPHPAADAASPPAPEAERAENQAPPPTPEPSLAEAKPATAGEGPTGEPPAPVQQAAPAQEEPKAETAAVSAATPVPAPEQATADEASPPAPIAEAAPPKPEPEPAQPPIPAAAEAPSAPAVSAEPAREAAQPETPAGDPDVLAELSSNEPPLSDRVEAQPEDKTPPPAAAVTAPPPEPATEKAVPDLPAPMEATKTAALATPAPAPAEPAAAPIAKPAAANLATDAAPIPPVRQNAPLDKVIGQMLVVGFRGLTPEESWPQRLAGQIKAGTVGGVLFMSHNVQSPQQLKTLTGFFQRAKADIPLLLAVDQEGGIVQRLSVEKGFQEYPTAGKIGKSNDPLTAYSVYRRLAAELVQNGFNFNLGPVVDLLRNDASPIIAGKERSFGPQPKHVAAFAKAFIVAHQDEGVLTALKHFPGHGSTPFDTHVQPVDVGNSWQEAEIEPYRDLIASKSAQVIMVGHIAHPGMAEEVGAPASLSAKAIRKVLRGDLGYSGVVISDDLEMGAIRERYSIAESAVKAIKAGNDIIILSNQNTPAPDLPERVTTAIKKAVETGVLRREELEASYDRILGLKQRLQGVPAAKAATANKRASAERGRAAPTR